MDESSILVDDAIERAEQDILGRVPKVKALVDEILLISGRTSIAFGITGGWGTGKTSFLNLIVEEIEARKRDNILVVKFNPWINLGGKTIIQEFFDILLAEIRPKDYNIWGDLERYSQNIMSSSPGGIYQLLGHVIGSRGRNDTASGFQGVNDSLKKLNVRFLVILDDMDRLKPEEVFEVLKLIRNTANFDNFIYLAAYDKSYISNSLKAIGIPNYQNFIDKIFLREEQLSLIREEKIKDYFADLLKSLLKEESLEIDNYFDSTYQVLKRNREDFCLKHIRDVKRFLNSFLQDYKGIKGEVVFKDYLNIKLLKYKFYGVYRLLYVDRFYFLEIVGDLLTQNAQRRDAWQLAFDDKITNKNNRINRPFEDFRIGVFIKDNLNLESSETLALKKLIFDLYASDTVAFRNHQSIVFTKNDNRYFEDFIGKDEISEQDFNKAFNEDLESLRTSINRWEREGKIVSARNRFTEVSYRHLGDKKEYEKFVQAIFFIASLPIDKNEREFGYFGFDHKVIIDLIGDEGGVISQRFYKNNQGDLKNFVLEILQSEDYSRTFISMFLRFWYSDSPQDNRWVFTKKEIKKLILENFKAHVDNHEPSDEIWTFYRSCSVMEWDSTGSNSWKSREHRFPEGQDIMRNFIQSNLDYFLVDFIRPQPSMLFETSDKIILMDWVEVIYGSKEEFMQFLVGAERMKNKGNLQSAFLDEFLIFMKKLKNNSYEGVPFSFRYSRAQKRLSALRDRV